MSEADLYAPIKKFLEAQGYAVKGEIDACDIVALRNEGLSEASSGDESMVVVELKTQFNLALVLQAVDRLRVCDHVYIAFRVGKGQSASWRTRRKQVLQLLRRLGVGLLTVSTRNRSSKKRLTAYRQDALRCARELSNLKELKVSEVRDQANVERAGPILRDNHYGWFERTRRGYYALSPKGAKELDDWP